MRFPKIFTSVDLENALQNDPRINPANPGGFALLEPEAVTLALDCAAAEPGSSVLVCPYNRWFSTMEAASILSNRDFAGKSDPLDAPLSVRESGLMFPAESVTGPVTGGNKSLRAIRIESPIYPVDPEMSKVLSDEFLLADLQTRAGWLGLVTRSLYQIATSSRAGSGVAPDNR